MNKSIYAEKALIKFQLLGNLDRNITRQRLVASIAITGSIKPPISPMQ